MKPNFLLPIVLLGALAVSAVESQAGPKPGVYDGTTVRASEAAKTKIRQFPNSICIATNPQEPGETFSTRVICSGSATPTDKIFISLNVLPTDEVRAIIVGSIVSRTTNRPVAFSAVATGEGDFTETSFEMTGEDRNFFGVPARIDVSAKSQGNIIRVQVQISGITKPGHPLRSYSASFLGFRR